MSEKFESQIEQGPRIVINRASEAPQKVKENPFYDPELWGQATSPDNVYLPDKDEALSFVIAAHEVGHLVEEDKIKDTGIDKFKNVRAEEARAWDKGWEYMEKRLEDYFGDGAEEIEKIKHAFVEIKKLMMQAVDLSEGMYVNAELSTDEKERVMEEQRKKFFNEKGEEMQKIFEKIKDEKNNKTTDWDKFVAIVQEAIKEILEDNKKFIK